MRKSPQPPSSGKVPEKRTPSNEGAEASGQLDQHNSLETIEGVFERKLEPVLGNLTRTQREQVISTAARVAYAEAFSGPMPHPRHLREYEVVLPGTASRILKMTENMMDHNIASMQKAQRDDHRYRLLGMWLGFLALILLVLFAGYAGMNGNNLLSGMFLGTGVLSSIGVFVSAHVSKDKE